MSAAAILLLHVLAVTGQTDPALGQDGKEGSGRLHALLTDVGHRPVADADLVLHSIRLEDGERHWSRVAGRSAADGSFECSAPAGRWVLVATQGGMGAALDLGIVAAGIELRHELTLREVEALQGLVLWPNGATAERAELVLLGPDTEVGGRRLPAISHELRTDEDGRFLIERGYGLERLRARATVDWKIRRKIRRGWDVGLPQEVVEPPAGEPTRCWIQQKASSCSCWTTRRPFPVAYEHPKVPRRRSCVCERSESPTMSSPISSTGRASTFVTNRPVAT